jgi:hypothetical protein
MFIATISTGCRNGHASFDFFRFLRVDRQNLYWAFGSEGVPDEWDVEGQVCVGVGFAGEWVVVPSRTVQRRDWSGSRRWDLILDNNKHD